MMMSYGCWFYNDFRVWERLYYARYSSYAEFVQPDKVKVLYSDPRNLTLEEYGSRDYKIGERKEVYGWGGN